MKIKLKHTFIIPFFIITNLYSYEIIRDPIFEDYFSKVAEEFNFNKTDTYLLKSKLANAFVIKDKIYFTTGLLEVIENEDTLKAIYLHEYGHILKNHFQAKNIEIQNYNNKNTFYSLFSIGLAVITSNANIAIGTSITLNSNLINEISKHSINFEIEADDFMIKHIKKNNINTFELIDFLDKSSGPNNNYFRTHPNKKDRINSLKEIDFKKSENTQIFEWLKSKYSKNSSNQSFNSFFQNLEEGIFNQDKIFNQINEELIQYEAFKKGILVNNWDNKFHKLLQINNSSFLKIEYISYLIDNNLLDKFYIIEDLKFDRDIMKEYFYYFIYGKYYRKVNNINLSNFYFCQFYRLINYKNKADFFCKKYDIKDIPTLDKSYALFK